MGFTHEEFGHGPRMIGRGKWFMAPGVVRNKVHLPSEGGVSENPVENMDIQH